MDERRSCRGSAMITVTVIGMFVMVLAAGLVNHFAVAEAKAVATSLAKSRVYWAAMGHVNYMLSRTQRTGLCGAAACADDVSRSDTLRTFFNEIDNNGPLRDWTFEAGYTLSFTFDVEIDPVPDPDDGGLRIKITLNPIAGSNFETLNGLEGRVRDLRIDLCLTFCANLGAVSSSGDNKIEFLQRVQL